MFAVLGPLDGFVNRQFKALKGLVGFYDLTHLFFYAFEVFFGQFLVAQVNIVVKAMLHHRADAQFDVRPQGRDSSRHDVCQAVAHGV